MKFLSCLKSLLLNFMDRLGESIGRMPHEYAMIVFLWTFIGLTCWSQGTDLSLKGKERSAIKTVDMKGTVATFLIQASEQHLSPDELKNLTKRFTAVLNQTTQQYVASHHCVLIVKNAVISGAQDVTPEIQMLIAQTMKDKKEPSS